MGQTVAFKLPCAEIATVTGTVNGIETPWELYQGDVWRTIVPRSEDGAYHIAVTGWDVLGRGTTYTTTLQYGFAAITSRRSGAFYNASDLNRVGRAVEYLTDLLGEYGYHATTNPRTNWLVGDLPSEGDMAVYLSNIRALLECYCIMPTTPPLPQSMEKLGYQGANAIEQILVDMHILITNMAAAWFSSGDLFLGEV